MYFDMKRDEAELQAAFAHFKQCENVKSWHWKFHDNDELHSRGVGQYYAMLTLKAAMPDSVRDHGLGNQAKMHENMEGFLAWSMNGQDNMVWKSAAMNMMSSWASFTPWLVSCRRMTFQRISTMRGVS